MIEDIIDFFNKNQTYAALIVLVSVILLIYFYRKYCEQYNNSEHLSVVSTDSNNFNENFVGGGKKINLKCNVNGIDYYLANIPITQCDKTVQSEFTCQKSVLVLIPTQNVEDLLKAYLLNMQYNIEDCNDKAQKTCIRALPNGINSTDDEKKTCDKTYPMCAGDPRFFIHDFEVQQLPPDTTQCVAVNKYLFKGQISATGGQIPTLLNQQLMYTKNIPLLCGDSYAYGSNEAEKPYAEIIVSERQIDMGGIISDQHPIKIKIMFSKQKTIQEEVDGKLTWRIATVYYYLGLCPDDTYTCAKIGGTSTDPVYKRVCLISSENITTDGAKILEFDPILVNLG